MVLLGFLMLIFIINSAPPQFPVINHSFECIEVNSNYGYYGNYNKQLYGIGWFDQCAFKFNRFDSFGAPGIPETYRDFVGPINIIRTNCWSLTNYGTDPTYFQWCNNYSGPIYFFVTLLSKEEVQGYRNNANYFNSIGEDYNFEETLYIKICDRMSSIDASVYSYVIGWYTLDEPLCHEDTHHCYVDPEDFKLYNELIRKAENYFGFETLEIIFNPYSIHLNNNGKLVNFLEYAKDPNITMICNDPYPFYGWCYHNSSYEFLTPNFEQSIVREMATKIDTFLLLMEQNGINDKPFYILIQGNAHKDECPNDYWHRVASYAELRYQTFYAITMGVEGIFPWCARSLYQTEDYPRTTYEPSMDSQGWDYLLQVEGIGEDDIDYFKNFFKNEETLVFGNIRTIFHEIEPYTLSLINNDVFDNVLYWQIFNPKYDSVVQDTTRIKNFLKTLYIKIAESNDYIFIGVNNNQWFSDIWNTLIQPQIFRFSFNDSMASKSITFTRQDPLCYDTSANFCDLEPAPKIEIPVINNIKFFPDNYSGFTHPNEKYLYDYFGPGEVHVYKVIISNYEDTTLSNILATLDGKYRLDKFQGFDDVNDTLGHSQFTSWFYTDLTCGADSNWSTYVDGGAWFNITKKYSLPIGIDNRGNVYSVNGLSRYLNSQGFDDVNTSGHTSYPGWYYSDVTVYHPNGDPRDVFQNAGPWHNIDSGYTLPMVVDVDGNFYVANAKSRYDDTLIDGFDDVPTWNPQGYMFYEGWYYSDITKYNSEGQVLWTERDIGPWHNQTLRYSFPFAVDGNGTLYVVNAKARYSDSLYFDTTGIPGWFKTDICIYDDGGKTEVREGIGPWHCPSKGYCLPMTVDDEGNIIVCNALDRVNNQHFSFDDVNTTGHTEYTGWYHSDITIYNDEVMQIIAKKGPWHNIDSGYSLPMAVDGNGRLYIANALSRFDDPLLDGFDDVNTAGHEETLYNDWFYSDVSVIDINTGAYQYIVTNRDRGPWHSQKLGFSLPMISTMDYINPDNGDGSFDESNLINMPLVYFMNQNFPNPFSLSTTINFFVSKEVEVNVSIYNILGQRVRTLTSGIHGHGMHSIAWERTDNHNSIVANGIYFCRMSIKNEESIIHKMLVVD